MGIVVQRAFSVAPDDRREFERQSREGVWARMRYFGSDMIAYGTWGFGAPGDVVVTNSAYEDFDHWTATRAWGAFQTTPERLTETEGPAAISAGRPRLIREPAAHAIEYDDELSEPSPRYRQLGEELLDLPPTFGPRSIVAETSFEVASGDRDALIALSTEEIWSWYGEQGARLLLVGRDMLRGRRDVTVMLAYRSISEWQRLGGSAGRGAPAGVNAAMERRDAMILGERTRVLMIGTTFGRPV